MKIAIVSNRFPPAVVGGAEIAVYVLSKELMRRGISVVVITTSADGQDGADVVDGITVHRLRVENLYQPFTGKRNAWQRAAWHALDVYNADMEQKVGRVLQQEQPDFMASHNLAGLSVSVWRAAKRHRLPIVHTIHDYYLMCPASTMQRGQTRCPRQCLKCAVYSGWKKRASAQVDLVIGVSEFVLQKHLRHGYFRAASAHVVHNGVELQVEAAEHTQDDAPELRPLRIGYIGRLEPSKGIEVLLRAIAQLPAGPWRLVIGGRASDPSYLDRLKRTFPVPAVSYLGFVRPEELYRQVDVVVVPSTWDEPLGLVAIEALGFGVPVIASHIGGLPEVIASTDYGWLVQPGDADELAKVLRSIVEDRRLASNKRSAALRRKEFFSPQRQADEFLGVVRQFL